MMPVARRRELNHWRPRRTIMRDTDVIDAELHLLAVVRQSIREQGGEPGTRVVDRLLDERLKATSRGCGRLSRFV